VALAFYLAFVLGIALSIFRDERAAGAATTLSISFLILTFIMMALAVAGLRNVFSLPITLNANWVLRTTQLRPSHEYVAATRRTLQCVAVVPVLLLSGLLGLHLRPLSQVAAHLAVLALIGIILVEVCLIGFYKVPFTCSYLPGKSNIQLAFWGFIIVLVVVVAPCAAFEMSALQQANQFGFMLSLLAGAAVALNAYNHWQARYAVLYYEETPEELITTLGLSA
jgi:hypothetical protein